MITMKKTSIAAVIAAAGLLGSAGMVAADKPQQPEGSVSKWQPETSVSCESVTFSHPEFWSTVTNALAQSYEIRVDVDGVLGTPEAYEANSVVSVDWDGAEVVQFTVWGHTFAKQQLGQKKVFAPTDCVIEEPPAEEEPPAAPTPPVRIETASAGK